MGLVQHVIEQKRKRLPQTSFTVSCSCCTSAGPRLATAGLAATSAEAKAAAHDAARA